MRGSLFALAQVLGDVGEVVRARSGTEALRHLLREEFEVILLDVLMPDMAGTEAVSLFRQREQLRRTPIIFLSDTRKTDASMLCGHDVRAVDYALKPFEP